MCSCFKNGWHFAIKKNPGRSLLNKSELITINFILSVSNYLFPETFLTDMQLFLGSADFLFFLIVSFTIQN